MESRPSSLESQLNSSSRGMKSTSSTCVRSTETKKIHLGLCIGYSGVSFRGLQLQTRGPTHETVEGTLLQALCDVGLIALENGRPQNPSSVMLCRACRTDRGVHAIRNMVTLRVSSSILPKALEGSERTCDTAGMDEDGEECRIMPIATLQLCLNALTERINDHLPCVIRVLKVSLLPSHFIPRHCCSRRVYRYVLPAYALLPPADSWDTLWKAYPNCKEELHEIVTNLTSQGMEESHTICPYPSLFLPSFGENVSASGSSSLSKQWVKDLASSVEKGNQLLQKYVVGSHRFHNFCVDMEVHGKLQSLEKVVSPWSDEAVRHVYRCEIIPQLYFIPADRKGPTRRENEAHYAFVKKQEEDRFPERFAATANSTKVEIAPSMTEPSSTRSSCSLSQMPLFLPFLIFQIEGNSFLFNMIRKVLGALLATCRGTRESIWEDLLSPTRSGVAPLAPAPYLFLSLSRYDGYDHRLERSRASKVLSGTADTIPSCNPFRGESGCFPIKQEWSGAVAQEADTFAWSRIIDDIVDIDLRRTPELEELLRHRYAYLCTRRPSTAKDDAHLMEGKTIGTKNGGMKQMERAGRAVGTTSSSVTSPPSEMTMFLRGLRMHNWMWRDTKLPECSTVGKESRRMAKRRKNEKAEVLRKEEVRNEVKNSAEGETLFPFLEVHRTSDSMEGNDATDVEEEEKDFDDGWIYWGDSREKALQKRKSHIRRDVGKISRPWES